MTGARVRAEHGALSSAPRTTEDDVVMHTCSLSTQEGEAGGPVVLAYRLSTTGKGLLRCADVIDLDCSGVQAATPLAAATWVLLVLLVFTPFCVSVLAEFLLL